MVCIMVLTIYMVEKRTIIIMLVSIIVNRIVNIMANST
jgi:hypothetical protein